MTAVMGIDPSLTCTAVAVVHSHLTPWYGVVKTKPSQMLGERLLAIEDFVQKIADMGNPVLTVVERPFSGGKGPSAPMLGAALGAALRGLTGHTLLVPPKVRAKYATGNGNAGKEQVLSEAIKRLGYSGYDNNEADALWLAWIAAEVVHLEQPELWSIEYPSLPEKHYDPIDKWQEWERVL